LVVSACLELGAELFQGYYFSRPAAAEQWKARDIQEQVERCATRNKDAFVRGMLKRREEEQKQEELLSELAGRLATEGEERFELALHGMALKSRDLECLFVLDWAGVQVTRTVTMQYMRGRVRGPLFQPAPKGTDHSMKDYCFSLAEAGLQRFRTDPYVSLASGNLCRTLSCAFQAPSGKDYILCMDVKA
jgi:hypothetical protein